jgi:hypothetical protein
MRAAGDCEDATAMSSYDQLHVFDAARGRRVLIGAVLAVVCALAPAPALAAPPGLTHVVAMSALGSDLWNEHSARCPDGTAALSAGYEWIGGGNDLRLYEVQYSSNIPPTMAWVAASPDDDGIDALPGYGTAWGIRVHLICASPLPEQHERWHVTPNDLLGTDSTDMKTSVARCPSGTSVYGVGGGVHWYPTTRGLVIDENWTPNATLTAASVTAQEDELGTTDGWRVWAQAVCADRLAGMERVGATSVGGSASSKEVTATCPAGKRVVGMGGDIRRAHGEVVITALAPTHDLTGVRVAAREDDTGSDANWYAAAYAICA